MKREKENRIVLLWRLCPVRWTVLLLSLAWIGVYFALRQNRGCMNFLCRWAVRPWHRLAGRLSGLVRFSLAEWCILVAFLAAGFYFLQLLLWLIRTLLSKNKPGVKRLVTGGVTFFMLFLLIFGLFCLWWGVFYYSDSFIQKSGLERRDVSTSELATVTEHFIYIANSYVNKVSRNEDGVMIADTDALLDASAHLYDVAERVFPCLEGPPLRAKAVHFSRILSHVNYTGFFFPYTAEANINIDPPACLLPSTIAHELAHQRGVAGEDEANFVAVFASLESGEAEYVYSAALLAYIHLGNALYGADRDAWAKMAGRLSDTAWKDLLDNNEYWDRFEGKAAEVSEQVYESYLQIYGDDRGMKSYGACVDLLVCYYLDAAS